MMRNINTEFYFGDIVYLKTDPDQLERIITGIILRPIGCLYYVQHNTSETVHYDMEMTKEINQLKKFQN